MWRFFHYKTWKLEIVEPFPKDVTPNTRIHWTNLLVFTFLIQILLYQPFTHVGVSTPGGKVYRSYFNGDLLKHVAVAAELSKGQLPPRNPYFNDEEALHYYWFFYLFPSRAYSAIQTLSLERCMLLLSWILVPVSILSLFQWILRFASTPRAAIFAVVIVLFAYSYDGLLVLQKLIKENKTFWEFTRYNVDAATRWFFGPPEIDGYYRAFLYNPQHLFALSMIVTFFVLIQRSFQQPNLKPFLAGVFLIGGLPGHSAFLGYATAIWVPLWLIISRPSGLGTLLKRPILWLACFAIIAFYFVAYFCYPALYDPVKSGLLVSVDEKFLHNSFLVLFFSFGPLLVFGVTGIVLALKNNDRRLIPPSLLLFVSVCNIFFVSEAAGRSDIAVKLGYTSILSLAALTGYSFSYLKWKTISEKILFLVIGVILLAALPTIGMEWYNAQDITNKRWLTWIKYSDKKACDWIRNSLPADAIVQSWPVYDSVGKFTLLPSFAQRRTAVGDPMHAALFEVDQNQYQEDRFLINLLFQNKNPYLTYKIACNLGIQYIYFGPKERRAFDDSGLERFQDPNLFKTVYNQEGVSIFQLAPGKSCRRHDFDIDSNGGITTEGVKFKFGAGFYDPQLTDQSILPFRIVSSHANIILISNKKQNGELAFQIRSIEGTRKLKIWNEDILLVDQVISSEFRRVELSNLQLSAGVNHLVLDSSGEEGVVPEQRVFFDERKAQFQLTDLIFVTRN